MQIKSKAGVFDRISFKTKGGNTEVGVVVSVIVAEVGPMTVGVFYNVRLADGSEAEIEECSQFLGIRRNRAA